MTLDELLALDSDSAVLVSTSGKTYRVGLTMYFDDGGAFETPGRLAQRVVAGRLVGARRRVDVDTCDRWRVATPDEATAARGA